MTKICGVYLIVNPSGKRYVGSSVHIKKRWRQYKCLCCGNQRALYNSFIKYGIENHIFSVLYQCDPLERLMWERIFGDIYLSMTDYGGLNHSLPRYDERPFALSVESRLKMSESLKKIKGTPEARIKNKERVFKYLNSEEAAKKRGGLPYVQKNKAGVIKNGRPSEETIISIRGKLKEWYLKNPHPAAKKVINIETNEIFYSAKIVSDVIGMNVSTFNQRLNGKMKNNTPFRYLKTG